MSTAAPDLRTEISGRALTLSNLDKVLFPSGATKAEVISYYVAIAPVLLPHLANRCITRLRFPDGTAKNSFYEKNAPGGTPDWVRTEQVRALDSVIDYVVADDDATLVWLANLAALELHTPQWRMADSPTAPVVFEGVDSVLASSLVIDLDPGPGIAGDQIARAAMITATELAAVGLVPFVKTSGSKGMQVFTPIEPAPWRAAMEQVRRLGLKVASAHRDLFVTTMSKQARAGRIYLDHLQNRADRNTISVYSLRGRDHPWVSAPLTWDEVAQIGPGDQFQLTSDQVLSRVAENGDLWEAALDPATAGPLPEWPLEPPRD